MQIISGQGYHSTFVKLSWYESVGFQRLFIGLAAGILLTFGLVVFLVLPLVTLLRKLCGQTAVYLSKPALAVLI